MEKLKQYELQEMILNLASLLDEYHLDRLREDLYNIEPKKLEQE